MASSASSVTCARLPPSVFAVSSSIGRRANRGSFRTRRNISSPRCPFADVLVAIDAAAERGLRVVQVKPVQAVQSNHAIEPREHIAVTALARDVVPGGQQVAGVEPHADARRLVGQLQDARELLERVAEHRALSSRVLGQHAHACARPCLQRRRRANRAISWRPASSAPPVQAPGCSTNPVDPGRRRGRFFAERQHRLRAQRTRRAWRD